MSGENVQTAPYPEELADLVSKLTYRPNWRFALQEQDRGQGCKGLTFIVVSSGYDTYNPERGETYRVQHFFAVPPAAYNRASWQRWIFEQLLSIEGHECAEFMVVDGERPFAPIHAPGHDPYFIREVARPEDARTTFRGEQHDEIHERAAKAAERIEARARDHKVPRAELRDVIEEAFRG